MKKKIAIIISVLVVVAIMVIGLISIVDNKQIVSSDAAKFKEEYELLNGKYEEELGFSLNTMEIDKNNPIKYLKDTEIVEKLTEGTNIVFLGEPENIGTRRVVPVILNFALKNKIETIYYYNISNLVAEYEKNEVPEKTTLYENIVKALDEYLTNTYSEGNHVGVKVLNIPAVYFVKDGKIIGGQSGLDTYVNYEKDLTKEQKEELMNNYQNYYNQLSANVCVEKAC